VMRMASAATCTPGLYRLDTLRVGLAMAMMFVLAAANGIPRWWNSAYPALLCSAALFAIHVFSDRRPFAVKRQHALTSLFFLLWIAAAVASWIAHPTFDSTQTVFYAYLIPASIYMALSPGDTSRREHVWLLIALSAGGLFPSLAGVRAYYNSFGIPSLVEAAWHRYDLVAMSPYQVATFGNIGHMSAYACLVGPTVLAAALTQTLSGYARCLFACAYGALGLNVLIVQSRAGLLVFMAMSIVVALTFRSHRLLIAAVAGVLVWLSQQLDDVSWAFLQQRLGSAITVNVEQDASIALRLDSVYHSWSLFARHPLFGVGPGLSRFDNPFDVAHQFFAHQAAELGTVGLIASIGMTLVIVGRFLAAAFAYRRSRKRWNEAVWLSGATGWLFYISIAGATLNITIVIAWAGLFAAFLALAHRSEPGPALG
jgi:hypothetical protein